MNKFRMVCLMALVAIGLYVSSITSYAYAYKDVQPGTWYYNNVCHISNRGIMMGKGDGLWHPGDKLTRAEAVTIIYRLDGKEKAYGSIAPVFKDVPENPSLWYFQPLKWCASNGIVTGYADRTFRPNQLVSRQEFVTMLHRYATRFNSYALVADYGTLDGYDSTSISPWALRPFEWACRWDIVKGKNGMDLDPNGKATRAEIATMIERYMELDPMLRQPDEGRVWG